MLLTKKIFVDADDGLHPSLLNSSALPTNQTFTAKPKTKLRADQVNGTIEIDSHTILTGVPALAWEYKLGNRSALEWILDQYKENGAAMILGSVADSYASEYFLGPNPPLKFWLTERRLNWRINKIETINWKFKLSISSLNFQAQADQFVFDSVVKIFYSSAKQHNSAEAIPSAKGEKFDD